jgi:hypothetical protein
MPIVTAARLGLVVLLLVAAYLAAAPWVGCAFVPPFWIVDGGSLRACTFGDLALRSGYGVPGFTGPFWGNLLAGIFYVIAALFVARRRRPL